MDYLIVTVLVLLSGTFSGLTLGLLSLDKHELERKKTLGDKDAARVYSIRKQGNLLLCTLLLGNVAVNAAIAIVLSSIASGFLAGIISTFLIVIFGEIIPQASVSRYALKIGARMAWLVKLFIFVFYPICWPLSWVLDRMLGDEMPTVYSKRELMKIVHEHEISRDSDVDEDEYRIVKGALSFSDETAEDIMTPRIVVYALESNTVVTKALLNEIREKGFTRIPVYEEEIDDFIGMLFVKKLIGHDYAGKTVGEICDTDGLLEIGEEVKLDAVLNSMLQSKSHMAFVVDEYGGLSGIVTMEDIMEEIIDIEIMDESDEVRDMQKYAKAHKENIIKKKKSKSRSIKKG